MKYLLLSYTEAANWDAATSDAPTEEALAAFAAYQQFEDELRQRGEFVTSEGLSHPAAGMTVRKRDDGVHVSDGPYAELKEVLASFAIIDVDSMERAVDIVQRMVAALGGTAEIRPIVADDFAASGAG